MNDKNPKNHGRPLVDIDFGLPYIHVFPGGSILKLFGLLYIHLFGLRAAGYSNFKGCLIFKVFGRIHIQTVRADRYSSIRAAWYSNFSGLLACNLFGLLDIQKLDIHTCRAAR